MSLRDRLLPVADRIRSIAGPTKLSGAPGLDVRPNSLSIVTRTWPGRIGDTTIGSPSEDRLDITPVPKIRSLTSREIAASGGLYEEGDLLVGPITPAYDGGGYANDQLAPKPTDDVTEIVHRITGPSAGDYRLVELRRGRPFRFELVLRRMETTP